MATEWRPKEKGCDDYGKLEKFSQIHKNESKE